MTSANARAKATSRDAALASSTLMVLHSAKVGAVGQTILVNPAHVAVIIPVKLAPENTDSACKAKVVMSSGVYYDTKESVAEISVEYAAKVQSNGA